MDFTNNKNDFENTFTFESSSPPKQPAPPSPVEAHKAKYKRNSLPRNAEEARQRRIELDAQARRKHRDQLITTKRFKHNLEEYKDDDAEPEYNLSQKDIEKLKSGLNNVNRDARLSSLQDLSKYLVDPSDILRQFVIEGDCIEILIKFLSSIDPAEQLQATWCITNIAAGPKEFVQKASLAIPYLIPFLERENIPLQDQAAWAIGNIAIESSECRELLRKNGVLVPLIKLLDSKDVNLIQTACFALSNLARGPNANLHEFFAAGINNRLIQHLETDESFEVVSEVSWVLTYITSDDDNKYTAQLLNEGIAPLLVKHMRPLLNHGPLSLPLVRTFGNIASGPDTNTDHLIRQPDFLPSMIQYIQSDCRPVKKESLWVMSNITATRRPEVLVKVFNAGFIPILSNIATHTNFDIRKEAAYSLVNIASHGVEFMKSLPHQELLPENVKGIDAIETAILTEDESLRNAASRLMDKYFGEEFSEQMQVQIEETT
ncbi:11355_t:CDS:10 [Funneliformis caledonium]|uniref:Importin subunit alpha n=1 Tax=Funneliformis caledonium TaxID=1117310 RepID=A0A9N9HDX8_9GLOM|nr:11355_t:CDS:10 [Funneliformis caledonium]